MTFDPKLVLTFVAVADTQSFTRTAEQLGMAQPWVSEQVRRLEEQLGFRLIERSSRPVELTSRGARFLAYARPLVEANAAAQKFAKELANEAEQTLRVGAHEFVADLPARTALIDYFIEENRSTQLQIHIGSVPDLIIRAKRDELDVVLAHTRSVEPADGFEATVISSRIAHLMMPKEDPLSRLDAVPLTMLAGRTVISSTGRTDPAAYKHVYAGFLSAGAIVQPAPESLRSTVEHYAQIRRLMCLRWSATRMERTEVGDMVCLPIAGEGAPSLEVAVLRPRGRARRVVFRFCAIARDLAEDAATALDPDARVTARRAALAGRG